MIQCRGDSYNINHGSKRKCSFNWVTYHFGDKCCTLHMAKKKKVIRKKAHPRIGEKKKRIEEVSLMLEKGNAPRECIEYLVTKYEIHPKNARNYLTEVYKLAEANAHKEKDFVFSVHMERYEKIYASAIWRINAMVPPEPDQYKALTFAFREAMQALQAKEKLLGLHSKLVRIEVTNTVATIEMEQVKGPIKGYDYKKLSIEELMEMSILFEKGRLASVDGILPVRYKTYEGFDFEEAVVVEVEDDQLPEKVTDKFVQDNEQSQERALKEETKVETGSTLLDLKSKLHKTALDQYKEAMRRKQGNKEHPE